MVKISITNSKLGGIPSVNLPPIVTCREGAPCSRTCYACKGNCRYKNVMASWLNNLTEYKKDSKLYFKSIVNYLSSGLVIYRFFRWHSSGDLVDYNYLKGVINTAKATPLTRHLLFTKKYELVNEYLAKGEKLPANLSIVFSAWGDDFKFENPFNWPIAYIKFKNGLNCANIPADATPCAGNCATCQKCWFLHNGESVYFNQH